MIDILKLMTASTEVMPEADMKLSLVRLTDSHCEIYREIGAIEAEAEGLERKASGLRASVERLYDEASAISAVAAYMRIRIDQKVAQTKVDPTAI